MKQKVSVRVAHDKNPRTWHLLLEAIPTKGEMLVRCRPGMPDAAFEVLQVVHVVNQRDRYAESASWPAPESDLRWERASDEDRVEVWLYVTPLSQNAWKNLALDNVLPPAKGGPIPRLPAPE